MKIWIFIIGGFLGVLNHFKFSISSNQEYYLGLAKWWANPEWIPGSFLLSGASGSRIGFNIAMAPFWNFFSFETIALGATFIHLFIIGGLMFLIANEIRRPTLIFMVLMHLTMFSGLGDKGFYSGEWIFGGAEPKTFAYIFALWGILLFMRNKPIWTFLLLAIGAYFHFIVAGWVMVILLIETLLKQGIKPAMKNAIAFGIGALPFVLYLLSAYFQKGVGSYEGADEIFISNIHSHLKPWLIKGKEHRFWLGLLYASIAAAFAFYRMKKVDDKTAFLYRLSIYAYLIPAVLSIFAPWEWFTPLLKTFPFRLTMMQKILFYIPLCIELSRYLENLKWKKPITAFLAVALVISGSLRIYKNLYLRWGNYQDKTLLGVAEVLSQKYEPGTSVFIVDAVTESPDDKLDPLMRMARVDVYYLNKFLPFEPVKMRDWNERKKLTIQIREDLSKISLLKEKGIEVVISKQSLPLELVTEIDEYKIYNFTL